MRNNLYLCKKSALAGYVYTKKCKNNKKFNKFNLY